MSKNLSHHRFVVWLIVLLGTATAIARADNPGRLVVANRQRVEAMMNVAQADGLITAEEGQSIIKVARNTFSNAELSGLQTRLSHSVQLMAARQHAAASAEARIATMMTQPAGQPSRVFQFASLEETVAPVNATIAPVNTAINDALNSAHFAPDACWAGQCRGGCATCDSGNCDRGECCGDIGCDIGTCDNCGCSDCTCDTCTCGSCAGGGWSGNCWDNISLFVGADGFKGPMDLDDHNGNFGVRYGVNAAFPLLELKNIGIQVGTAGVTSDFHGTEFTGSTARSQNFTTVGVFQRYPQIASNFSWGLAFDWLTDDYYANIKVGQWRMKFAFDLSCASEIGVWVCLPDHGDDVFLSNGEGYSINNFRPITQTNFYYRRYFNSGSTAAFWLGVAEEPGSFIIGGDSSVPITQRASLYGGFQCILPSSSGVAGQDEEMWDVSVGLSFTLGRCANRGRPGLFQPLMNVADNGIFAVRRR